MRQKKFWFTTSWISRCQEDDRNSLISGGPLQPVRLRVAGSDDELMLFSWLSSSITLWDSPWDTVTLSCPAGCHLFISLCSLVSKSASCLLPVRRRQISWGRFTYWAVFYIQSKAAALLLAPGDIQGGREEVWSFQHYMGVGILPWVPSLRALWCR